MPHPRPRSLGGSPQARRAPFLVWLGETGFGAGVVSILAELVARARSSVTSIVARAADAVFGRRLGEPFAAGMASFGLVAWIVMSLAVWSILPLSPDARG